MTTTKRGAIQRRKAAAKAADKPAAKAADKPAAKAADKPAAKAADKPADKPAVSGRVGPDRSTLRSYGPAVYYGKGGQTPGAKQPQRRWPDPMDQGGIALAAVIGDPIRQPDGAAYKDGHVFSRGVTVREIAQAINHTRHGRTIDQDLGYARSLIQPSWIRDVYGVGIVSIQDPDGTVHAYGVRWHADGRVIAHPALDYDQVKAVMPGLTRQGRAWSCPIPGTDTGKAANA